MGIRKEAQGLRRECSTIWRLERQPSKDAEKVIEVSKEDQRERR